MRSAAAVLFIIFPTLVMGETVTLSPSSYTATSVFGSSPDGPVNYLTNQTSTNPIDFGFSGSMSPYVVGEPADAHGATTATARFSFSSASVDGTINTNAYLDNPPPLSLLTLTSFATTSYLVEAIPLTSAPTFINFIPIIVSASASASCLGIHTNLFGTSTSSSSAMVSVEGSQSYLLQASCVTGGTDSRMLQATDLFGVRQAVSVTLSASAGFYLATDGTAHGTANAIADPTFQIDPSFAYANDYHLVFSDAGTANPVPEPSYWPLVLGSITLISFWGKRSTAIP